MDKTRHADMDVAEIGLRIYPDCQMAAIFGLTDLFRIAGDWTGDDPRRQSQRPFSQFVPRFDHGDDAIRHSQHHIHAHAATMQGVADLGAIAGMTARTFRRGFRAGTGFTPVEYLQRVRIARAREGLERTPTPADRIGISVGHADPAAFRKLFQRLTRLLPAAHRPPQTVRHRDLTDAHRTCSLSPAGSVEHPRA